MRNIDKAEKLIADARQLRDELRKLITKSERQRDKRKEDQERKKTTRRQKL